MVAQDHCGLVADVAQQALLLARLDRDAFEIVVRDAPVQHGAVEVVVRKAVFQAGDRAAGGRMRMHDAVRALDRGVDCRMQHEAGAVHRPFGLAHRVAVDVDQYEVRGRDLAVVQAERIDEEMLLRPRHAQRDVVEDQLDPAQHVEDAVRGGELDARLALGIADRRRFCGTRRGLEINAHGFTSRAP